MIRTQDSFGKRQRKNGVVAYHLVQSFKDFETTPEIAHRCGIELIEKLFADKYEVVLATHTDHNHLHNHILINAVSFRDGKKYRRSFKDYFIDIRKTSDEICREHCLSVIDNPQHKGIATVTITGKGNLSGTVIKNFEITPRDGTKFTIIVWL